VIERAVALKAEVVSNGMRRRIEAAVVVGGDGAASPVRTALGIRSRVHAYRDGYRDKRPPWARAFPGDFAGR